MIQQPTHWRLEATGTTSEPGAVKVGNSVPTNPTPNTTTYLTALYHDIKFVVPPQPSVSVNPPRFDGRPRKKKLHHCGLCNPKKTQPAPGNYRTRQLHSPRNNLPREEKGHGMPDRVFCNLSRARLVNVLPLLRAPPSETGKPPRARAARVVCKIRSVGAEFHAGALPG